MDCLMSLTMIRNGERVWNQDLASALTSKQFTQALLECGFTQRSSVDDYFFLSNERGESIVIQVFRSEGLYQILDFQPHPQLIKDAQNLFNEIRGAWRQVRG